jgi:hypothetical protein
MEGDSAHRWEIDQDEFGRPLLRHRHPTKTISAYVAWDADGVRYARCPACAERLRMPEATDGPAPGPSRATG